MTAASYKLRTVTLRVAEAEGRADTPDAAVPYLRAIYRDRDLDPTQEHVVMLALDGRHRVIGCKVVSSGTSISTQVDSKLFWRAALAMGAHGVIIAHNHPSGDLSPSRDDIAMTERFTKAGNLLEVLLLDHVILTEDKWLSFRKSRPEVFRVASW